MKVGYSVKLPFRRRRAQPGYHFVLLLILSGLLMVSDYYHCLAPLRQCLGVALAPLQYLVDASIRLGVSFSDSVASRRALLDENALLRTQQLLLQVKVQKLLALENENKQLRHLLSSAQSFSKARMLLARILAVSTKPLAGELVLDKGRSDGVCVGQSVLDANGIMGQITEVGLMTSRVLLITDPRSAVPVESLRSGTRGLVVGQGKSFKLMLTVVTSSIDIRPGDLLISSGLGGRYPSGYPVGTVMAVYVDRAAQRTLIELVPSARLDHNGPVVVVSPEELPAADRVEKTL